MTTSKWSAERVESRRGTPEGYDAFISYSHAVDGKLAPALQRGLHRLAKPWYQLPAIRVFRDTTSLSATPSLWSDIERALEKARAFILLASPAAAQSPWVKREVDWWLRHRSHNDLLIVVTEGAVSWNSALRDFDWTCTTALPSELATVFEQEPGWVDMRWARSAESVSLRHPEFRSAIATLAAPLHGVQKDTLINEDVRQQRIAMRLRNGALVSLAGLTVLALASALLAFSQRNEARMQRDIASSRQLASQSVVERSDRLDRSLLLSLTALRFTDTVEARAALAGALEAFPQVMAIFHARHASSLALTFSPDGDMLAVGDGPDVAVLDVAANGRAVRTLEGHHTPVIGLGFGSDGQSLASVSSDGEVRYWDWQRSHSRVSRFAHGHELVNSAFNPSLTMVALAKRQEGVEVWDLENDRKVAALEADADDPVLSVAFSPDGRLLAYGTDVGLIRFWDADRREPLRASIETPIGDYTQSVSALAFDPDGSMLAAGGGGGGVTNLFSVETMEPAGYLGGVAGERGPVVAMAFSPDGVLIVTGHADRRLNVWGAHTNEALLSLPGHGVVASVAFSHDSTLLASASQEGPVVLWRLGQQASLSPLAEALGEPAHSAYVAGLDLSPSEPILAAATFNGVEFWDYTSGQRAGDALALDDDSFFQALVYSPGGDILATAVTHYAFDARAEYEAAASGSLLLWDVTERRQRGEPLITSGPDITALAFAPHRNILASGDANGRIILWDTAGRRQLSEPLITSGPAITALAFAPHRNILASGDANGRIVLRDVHTDDGQVRSIAQFGEKIDDLAFSPDGQTLASAGGKVSGLTLWDVESGQSVVRPQVGTNDAITRVGFSADGEALAWGAFSIAPTEDLLVVWDADLDSWVEHACRLANRSLTQEEWDRYVGAARPYMSVCN